MSCSRCRGGVVTALVLVLAGCASSKSSNTARTGTEQLLISNAVDQSLNKVDFQPFNGHTVFLNDKFVDCVDKSYVISSVRHRLLTAGAELVDDPAKADVLVELRSGAIGTDTAESFVGVPEITLPGMLTLPEVRLLTRSSQKGIAKLGLVAIDTRTQRVLGTGGVSLAQSDTQNWFVMGVGPFKTGSIDNEVQTSTTGQASRVRNWIPASVAFNPPPQLEGADQQYAATEEAEATPVNYEKTAADGEAAQKDLTPPRRLTEEAEETKAAAEK